jgi:hypothetical protein
MEATSVQQVQEAPATGDGATADATRELRGIVREFKSAGGTMAVFRRFLSDAALRRRVMRMIVAECGGGDAPGTLEEMLRPCGFVWVDARFTWRAVEIDPARYHGSPTAPVQFDREKTTTASAFSLIDGLGHRPAGLERLLAYVAANPREPFRNPLVALGTIILDAEGREWVAAVYDRRDDREQEDVAPGERPNGGRCLGLFPVLGTKWMPFDRFLVESDGDIEKKQVRRRRLQ